MSVTLKLKRRSSAGATGAPAALKSGEIAYNENASDNTLYYGYGDDGSGNATSIIPIAGKGAFLDLVNAQTVAGIKSFSSSPLVPTATAGDNSTKAASTAFVTAAVGGAGGTQAQNTVYAGPTSGSGAPAFRILTAADIPSLLAAKISDLATTVQGYRLDQFAAPTAPVAFGSQRLTSVADPTAAQDAATKNYVDLAVQGLNPKAVVRAASTGANLTLSGTQTVDGIALVAGDRILVKDQTTQAQNGVYIVAAGAWSRATDMDLWSEVVGAYVFVDQGTINQQMGYFCTSLAGGTLGTTAITFVQFTGAGQITTGTGLSKSGNQINLAAVLAGISAVTAAADQLIYANGANTFALTSFTAFGRSLVAAASASAAQTVLGLGSMATQAANAVAITGGTIDGITFDGGSY